MQFDVSVPCCMLTMQSLVAFHHHIFHHFTHFAFSPTPSPLVYTILLSVYELMIVLLVHYIFVL